MSRVKQPPMNADSRRWPIGVHLHASAAYVGMLGFD